jgi:hypothetical protein
MRPVRRKREALYRAEYIWIVPLVAIAIGAWLAWDMLSKEGPTIKISFHSGEGLQAGQSQLKYKDIVTENRRERRVEACGRAPARRDYSWPVSAIKPAAAGAGTDPGSAQTHGLSNFGKRSVETAGRSTLSSATNKGRLPVSTRGDKAGMERHWRERRIGRR